MKKIFYLLLFSVTIGLFAACNKENDLDGWREANTNAYEAIKKNPEYQPLRTATGPEGVYYKILEQGTGTEHPLQTSEVRVLYKGTYYDGTVFDAGSSGNNIPVKFSTGGTVRGFSFALQNMVVGDKWEIWIPYYLGYGAIGLSDYYSVIIKGYTTLVFEVELVSITQYP